MCLARQARVTTNVDREVLEMAETEERSIINVSKIKDQSISNIRKSYRSRTQCAAVTTNERSMSDPPQECLPLQDYVVCAVWSKPPFDKRRRWYKHNSQERQLRHPWPCVRLRLDSADWTTLLHLKRSKIIQVKFWCDCLITLSLQYGITF